MRCRRIFARMSDTSFDYTGFYTILLTEMCHHQHEIVSKILHDCWSLYISNVHVLTGAGIDAIGVLYTFYPYTPVYCDRVKPSIQNYYINDSFVLNSELFPPKFRNFHKCPILVSTYNLPPYMILTPQPNGSYYTDGIDGITLRVISQQLNFTPIVRMSSTNLIRRITVSNHVSKDDPKLPRSLEMVILNEIIQTSAIFFLSIVFCAARR